jgi:hypothetical protein
MSLLGSIKSLFSPLPDGAIRYKGYTIAALPEEEFGRYRLHAVISKKDKHRSYTLIDRVADKQSCVKMTHEKAKKLIDQKGDKIFAH